MEILKRVFFFFIYKKTKFPREKKSAKLMPPDWVQWVKKHKFPKLSLNHTEKPQSDFFSFNY